MTEPKVNYTNLDYQEHLKRGWVKSVHDKSLLEGSLEWANSRRFMNFNEWRTDMYTIRKQKHD